MKTHKIIGFAFLLSLLWAASYSCGSGSSSPITPAQIPTSMEYAGGEVSGAISVQMGKTLSFIVKDANGDLISDPDITIELLDLSASGDVSVGKQAGVSKSAPVTDGSCGTTTISGTDVVLTAYDNWKGVTAECILNAYYGTTQLGTFDTKTSLSAAEGKTLSLPSSKLISNAAEPNLVTDSNGVVYACYRTLEGSWGINFKKSTDAGVTWSSPLALVAGTKETTCSVAVNGDNVAVVWRDDDSPQSDKLIYSQDGGTTFGSVLTVVVTFVEGGASGGGGFITSPRVTLAPQVVMDTNGVAHVISTINGPVEFDKYITACTSSACGSSVKITNGTADLTKNPSVAISSDNKIYAVWADTRTNALYGDVYISQIIYSNSSYSIGTASKITDSTGAGMFVFSPTCIVDRSGTPVIVWAYVTVTGPASYIKKATWDPSTGVASSAVLVSDVDPTELPMLGVPFIGYDNYVDILYLTYGVGYTDGYVQFTMDDDVGGFIPSVALQLTGFVYTRTSFGLATDPVGRPYVSWDAVTYVDYELATGDVYLAVGIVQ